MADRLWPDRSGTDSPPLAVRQGAAELASLRRLALQRALVAAAAALVAVIVTGWNARIGMAFAVGSIGELALAWMAEARRREVLFLLAAERDGYVLDEVRRFGASLTSWERRLALARSIEAILREAGRSDSVFLVGRVAAQAPALTVIARSLADRETSVEPCAVATLVLLLRDGSRSPLLNPSATPAELGRTVERILKGIHTREPAKGA